MRTAAMQLIETVKESSRKIGPYVLLELLLPGGTLFALALFLYRRQSSIGPCVKSAGAALALFLYRRQSSIGPYVKSAGAALARAWASIRNAVAVAVALIQTDECARPSAAATSPSTRGPARGACSRVHRLRCGSPAWRLPSFIVERCPALPRRA